ncbi:histone H2A family protein [Oesophagostomum dentatum]|uniref:Histone H2A n=1 Tax=Oesophagostomum dentatum TaxID=61180 RepID=A0A0B1SMQ2_OESDE|nr:histone H2A family protein [Oesophagostomum dentatum]
MGAEAPVYSVLESLSTSPLELAGNAARDNKKTKINLRHLQLAVRNDDKLNSLLSRATIMHGGVLPNIYSVLLPNKTAPESKE